MIEEFTYERMTEMKNAKKILVLLLCAIALVVASVAGTVAYLTANDQATNTFAVGNVEIELKEFEVNQQTGEKTEVETDGLVDLELVPGRTIQKNPFIIVGANSEPCWLFVKIGTSENFGDFLTYEMAEGWIALEGVPGVYYRETTSSDEDQVFEVLKDNKVCVKSEVTKEMLNALDANNEYPVMKITAYAVQRDAALEDIDTAAEAWLLATPVEDAAL